MNFDGGGARASMIGANGFSHTAANAPEVSLAQRRCESEGGESRCVEIHLLVKVFKIQFSSDLPRQADIHIGAIGQHRFHRPLPEVMPSFVLRTLEMDFRRMKR